MTVRAMRFGAVASLKRRRVQVDPSNTYEEIGIRSFGKGIFHKNPVKGAILGSKRVFEIYPGDLVLSNVFAWEGAIAFATDRDSGRIGSHRFLTYRTDPDVADANYLHYFFLSEIGLPLIRNASPGAAGRNRTLGIEAFENLKIPLPDIDRQRHIAAWLDHLHGRRHEVSQHAKGAASLIKALHSTICRVNGPMERVGEKLTLVRNPVSVDITKTYRQIGIYSFGRGMIRRDPLPGSALSKLRYFEVPPGALVLSNIQAWEGAVAVSADADKGFIASNRFLSYIPVSGDIDVNYLRYFFLSDSGHPLIQQASPGTMVRNRTLGIKAFEDLKIPMPDIAEQGRIACLLDRAYGVLRRIEAREKLLDTLVASALNQAFGGLG